MTNQKHNDLAQKQMSSRRGNVHERIGAKTDDWWVYRCGNEADADGFFPCN